MTRADALARARHCLLTARGAPVGDAVIYLAEMDDLRIAHDIQFEELLPQARCPSHALTRISAARIPAALVIATGEAIRQAIIVAALRRQDPDADWKSIEMRLSSPRWRRGSNSWRPNTYSQIRDIRLPETPCPNCGADGGELLGADGMEVCPSCHQGFVVGDYDRTSLADCLRLATDLADGLVEPTDRCQRCDRLYDHALHDMVMRQDEPFCASAGCPLGGDIPRFDEHAVTEAPERMNNAAADPGLVDVYVRTCASTLSDVDAATARGTDKSGLLNGRRFPDAPGKAATENAAEAPGDVPATPPGTPNSDATAAVPAVASIARPIGPPGSGHSTTLEDGA